MNERLTDIEVALAYDRRSLEEMNEALIDAHKEIEGLKLRVKRLEEMIQGLSETLDGAPANEKPPHY